MNKRIIGLILLILCVMGGLIAALFSPALAANLQPLPTPMVGQPVTPSVGQVATVPPATGLTPQPTQLPAGMIVLARDTFQRANQSLWGQTSDGHNWIGDANTSQAFTIASDAAGKHFGQISGGQGKDTVQAIIDVPNASPDLELLFSSSINQFDADGDNNLGGVLRWQDENNWYKVLIDGTGKLQLLKRVKGQTTALASQPLPFKVAGDTSYTIRFRVLGSNLLARVWPSDQAEPANWSIRVSDTDLKTGSGGIRVLLLPNTVIHLTSFMELNVPNTA